MSDDSAQDRGPKAENQKLVAEQLEACNVESSVSPKQDRDTRDRKHKGKIIDTWNHRCPGPRRPTPKKGGKDARNEREVIDRTKENLKVENVGSGANEKLVNMGLGAGDYSQSQGTSQMP